MKKQIAKIWQDPAGKFATSFLVLFGLFYFSYLALIGFVAPGGNYSPFLAEHLNAIHWMRWILLHGAKAILNLLGHRTIVNEYNLLTVGHNLLLLNYDCLGFGVMCFFSAFVIAYPKPLIKKVIFLVAGLVTIQTLNILRLAWLALYWKRTSNPIADHHTVFNISIYIIIAIALYFWVKTGNRKANAAN